MVKIGQIYQKLNNPGQYYKVISEVGAYEMKTLTLDGNYSFYMSVQNNELTFPDNWKLIKDIDKCSKCKGENK